MIKFSKIWFIRHIMYILQGGGAKCNDLLAESSRFSDIGGFTHKRSKIMLNLKPVYVCYILLCSICVLFSLLSCNKVADLSTFYLIDKYISPNKPTLLFLSDSSLVNYKRIKKIIASKEAQLILQQFNMKEINSTSDKYFNQLFYSYIRNYFIIIENDSIASIIYVPTNCDSLMEKIINYKKYPLKDCIEKVSLLRGKNMSKCNVINKIFKAQYLYYKKRISLEEYENVLIESVESLPYFFNRHLLYKTNQNMQDIAWMDSLNIWEKRLYKDEINELQLRRYHLNLNSKSKIVFEEKSFDFGKIKLNDSIQHIFYYTNKSTNNPAIIYDIVTTCGCTVATWKKAPIPPQKRDSIKVIIKGTALGYLHKQIKLNTNSSDPLLILNIKGEVNN